MRVSVFLYACFIYLCTTADTVSSDSLPILFKFVTLNVAICIVCLHFGSFCCLSSVADFWNLSRSRPFSTLAKSDGVYVCGLSVGHGYLSMDVFILINRSHSNRWAAVVPRLNWRSWPLSCEIHTSRTMLGIALGRQRVYSHTFTSIMPLTMGT